MRACQPLGIALCLLLAVPAAAAPPANPAAAVLACGLKANDAAAGQTGKTRDAVFALTMKFCLGPQPAKPGPAAASQAKVATVSPTKLQQFEHTLLDFVQKEVPREAARHAASMAGEWWKQLRERAARGTLAKDELAAIERAIGRVAEKAVH